MIKTLLETELPTKESLTEEALKYDKRGAGGYLTTPSITYIKGIRFGIKMALPFIQDSFKNKFKKIIE